MKVLTGILLFVLMGVHAYAQQDAKVIAEIAAGNDKTIKNAPFSAEAVSESVQVLADGNRIVRSSTSKLYRNSEGRFRRESTGGMGGVLGSYFAYGQGISIIDPVIGHRVTLDSHERTARVIALGAGQPVAIAGRGTLNTTELTQQQKAEIEKKLAEAKNLSEEKKAELKAQLAEGTLKAYSAGGNVAVAGFGGRLATTVVGDDSFVYSTSAGGKYETRTEELGTRDIEGVSAEGTRRITTIPEGSIGNERPIEIVYERWYSKELGLVVYSKHSDPRFGEQTYRLTNIVRAEPDPSLFAVPQGYKVLAEPPSVYRITTAPVPARSVVTPRPAAQPKPAKVVTVSETKP